MSILEGFPHRPVHSILCAIGYEEKATGQAEIEFRNSVAMTQKCGRPEACSSPCCQRCSLNLGDVLEVNPKARLRQALVCMASLGMRFTSTKQNSFRICKEIENKNKQEKM